MNIEAMERALHSAVMARVSLTESAKGASALECLILHPLIADAAALVISIESVLSAARATE